MTLDLRPADGADRVRLAELLRESAPPAVRASAEFTEICGGDAVCMPRSLGGTD